MQQDERTRQMDRLFSAWAKSDSPGCAAAVWQDGEVIYQQGYGMANLEYDIPITPATIFHVASVSKQFAAAAILLLEQDGLLSTGDDVGKTIPELHDFGVTITIDHLIHHTSGLRDQWELLVAAGWRFEDVITTADILDLVFSQRELNFQPGAEYAYCNTGYTLLGVIVERVSGKSLRQFCAERIFAPLGMTSTHFHDDYQEIVANRAYSYAEKDGVLHHSHLLYGTVGATSLFTTVGDLLKWEANFFDPQVGGQALTDKMVQQAYLNDGSPMAYASGVVVQPYRGLRTVSHSGGDAGYRTHVVHFPAQKFAVVVLSNLASMQPQRLALAIADIYLAEHLQPDATQPMTMPEADLQARAGWYYDPLKRQTLHITYEDGALRMWSSEKLEALDALHFRMINYPDIRLEFSDTRTQVTLRMAYVQPSTYQRIEPVTLSTEQLAVYAGAYHSDELGVDYRFVVENGVLCLKLRKVGTIPLTSTFADAFVDADLDYDLVFTRDEQQRITGFKKSSDRVRNLAFIRQGA